MPKKRNVKIDLNFLITSTTLRFVNLVSVSSQNKKRIQDEEGEDIPYLKRKKMKNLFSSQKSVEMNLDETFPLYPKLRCHIGAMKSDRELKAHRANHLVERSPLSVIDVPVVLALSARVFAIEITLFEESFYSKTQRRSIPKEKNVTTYITLLFNKRLQSYLSITSLAINIYSGIKIAQLTFR
ncbi:26050_t:CDS:2 [Gigaspora margarita]|uniref:26050_t:CDS:1 n=1 Tax=Gigaspora margarita TaxID=4874 RepID=A0ABN7UKB3_GIGMA|nr:26050_t:CDS:2 [Gigaspora margarita]